MKRSVAGILMMSWAAWMASGQTADGPPKFEIADVHVSAKSTNAFFRPTPARNGRYEIKTATMVDLIRTAYGFDPDKILGGPSWLEMNRYDVIAKEPVGATLETHNLMLQSLLEDRFHLKVHKDMKPLPTYALVVGKKPQLKEANGEGESGCKMQSGGPAGVPGEGGGMRLMMSINGTATTLNLGPDGTIQFNCRNMTMAAFADGLRGMMGANVGTNPVQDQTNLKGMWNFDLRWSLGLILPGSNQTERITVFDAVEKQLGMKLEERPVPTPVIVVDSVLEKPTENPPGVAEALPPIPVPTEFDVASVKPTDPEVRMSRFQPQPGGRFTSEGMPLRFLVQRAFNANNNDQLVGLPSWADTERYDVIAKAVTSPDAPPMDNDVLAPLIRNLLVERFKMTYHTEERPVTAYSLVGAKPKMKKADPESRTSCKNTNPPGAPPGTRTIACTNITMAQFAERIQNSAPGLQGQILDATGLTGGWDLALTFSQMAGLNMPMRMGPGGGDGGPAGAGAADPTGGHTIFEAIEKQLGLKLEAQKRPTAVTVIDHIEQKPTEN